MYFICFSLVGANLLAVENFRMLVQNSQNVVLLLLTNIPEYHGALLEEKNVP